MQALKQLNVADNLLTALPVSLRAAESLQRLFAYNNRLRGLESIACLTAGGGGSESRRGASGCDSSASPPSPEHQESDWVSLESVWLEGNPLCQEAVSELLTKAQAGMTGLKSLGLDLQQVWRSIMDILFYICRCNGIWKHRLHKLATILWYVCRPSPPWRS